jgi:hypothetical protein
MMTPLDTARAYYLGGLCPLPRVVGHVEPSDIDTYGEIHAIAWSKYKICRPDWDTIAAWFARGDASTVGITLLTGTPAGKGCAPLQIVDIETADLFDAFLEAAHFAGYADVLYRGVIERTPSGGAHIGFLCQTIEQTQKIPLARRAADHKIFIELLLHQPCTVAPTAMQCKPEHPVGVAYTLVQGSWTQTHEISPAQRQALIDVARSFNEMPDKVHVAPRERTGNRSLPGDSLNEAADVTWWEALLTRHGWRDVSRPSLRAQGVTYWQRPGKTGQSPSATLGACGQYFYVFSSNALPFEPETAYSAFAALTLLEYGGNFGAAAHALVRQGYGTVLRAGSDSLRDRAVSGAALLRRSTLRERAVSVSALLETSRLRETAIVASEVAPWH